MALRLWVALAVAVLVAVVAGRRILTDLVAGVLMRLARPYCPGEQLRLFVPDRGETLDAELVRIGSAATTLRIDDGLVDVPNTVLLRLPQAA